MFYSEILYIDPGTGGMLFTILFGLFGVAVFAFRSFFMKLKFRVSGGKSTKINENKIPIAIYTDNKRYWNVFEPYLNEFEKRKQKVVYLTGSEDDPVFEKDYKYVTVQFIGEGNKGFAKLNMLNAAVFVSSTPSLDVFQWKRSKNVDCYIHVLHAASDVSLYRMFGIDHYDAAILSGEYQIRQIRQLEEAREYPPKDVSLCGIPYMDEMKKRLDRSGPAPEHNRTVLIAPTWGVNGLLTRFNENLIDALIATGYTIIIRPHPQSYSSEKELIEHLMEKYNDPSKVEWNRDNDNFEVLRKTDIMISDYSGIIFDFSLVFDKPIIYSNPAFDVSPYDASWLDEKPWTFDILPCLGLELTEDNVADIKNLIDTCIEDPSFSEGRDRVRSETWVHMGEGTTRSVDFIMKKYNEVIAQNDSKKEKPVTPSKPKTKKFALKGS